MGAIAFPFAAVIGMDLAKQALLLLAVDPGLKGALIAAGSGIGKSLLTRAFASLLGDEKRMPFVEVPSGVTPDRLLGSLDLEPTLLAGKRRLARGLLALAHGGVLHVDGINLLDHSLVFQIASTMDTGVAHLERDGISAEFPSEFSFVSAYDPSDGEPSFALRDSVGIHVSEIGQLSWEDRTGILTRVEAFDRDPAAFAAQYATETEGLKRRITEARNRLPEVDITAEDRRRLTRAALRLGVEGHRADLFAVRLARARASLMGRVSVEESDLEAAVQLVLAPRAVDRTLGGQRPVSSGPETGGNGANAKCCSAPIEDLVIPAIDSEAPEGLLDPPHPHVTEQGQAGRRRDPEAAAWNRGRYLRPVARRSGSRKIALEATLRAAAPFQRRRRPATSGIQVLASDLRFKSFKQEAGMLIIFCMDASGSMALNRINQAKGALIRLLREAYLHRDRVALLSFRGDRAEVLLPPSRSVELAKRALDALPAGGGTPLGAGLQAALDVARHSRLRQALLVLFTDGRPNVTLGHGAIWDELEKLSLVLRSEGIASVVINTSHRNNSDGGAERLAHLLGGRHVYLPRPDAGSLYDALSTARDRVQGKGWKT